MSEPVLVRKTNGECVEVKLPKPNQKGITITGSVGLYGTNSPSDVRKVQEALNKVPAKAGGPNPALVVDGFVGHKTLTAIATFQQHHFGWNDQRVDPDNLTMATIRAFLPDAPGAPPGPPPTPRDKSTLPLVYATTSIAKRLVTAARSYVEASTTHVNGKSTSAADADKYSVLNVYFNLDKLPKADSLAALGRIDKVFKTMQQALANGGNLGKPDAIFQPDPEDQKGIYAFTYAGGFTRKGTDNKPMMSEPDNYSGPNLAENAIYICTGLDGMAGEFVAYNTVHEMAHWVGPEKGSANAIKDYSYRHKSDFYNLPAETALKTADSYAMFAVAAKDRVLVEDDSWFMPPMVIHGQVPKRK